MDKQESNFLIPILSAIAGVGAIITSISPLFLQNTALVDIFIDKKIISFSSLISFLIVLSTLWLMVSINSYSLFNTSKNPERIKLNSIIAFVCFSITFYLSRLLVDNQLIVNWLGSLIQLISYFIGFMFLAMGIGLMLRDSIQNFRRNESEKTKYERIKNLLLKSGKISFDLSLDAVINHSYQQGEAMDLINSKDVIFQTNGKKYHGIINGDYTSMILIEEVAPILVGGKSNISKK